MLGPVEIVLRGGLIVLHRPAPESLEHSPHQHVDVAVVSMVVLGDGFADRAVIAASRRRSEPWCNRATPASHHQGPVPCPPSTH
jgi:hypothetical protein